MYINDFTRYCTHGVDKSPHPVCLARGWEQQVYPHTGVYGKCGIGSARRQQIILLLLLRSTSLRFLRRHGVFATPELHRIRKRAVMFGLHVQHGRRIMRLHIRWGIIEHYIYTRETVNMKTQDV